MRHGEKLDFFDILTNYRIEAGYETASRPPSEAGQGGAFNFVVENVMISRSFVFWTIKAR
jgi:hypothetical protein